MKDTGRLFWLLVGVVLGGVGIAFVFLRFQPGPGGNLRPL